MDVILGAGGQVGSQVAKLLESYGRPVRRVYHHTPKQAEAIRNESEIVVADYFNRNTLAKAFNGGDSVLLLTPESMTSADMLKEARMVFGNYKAALKTSGITRVVGLSSCGAQVTPGTGTLQLYAQLEETVFSLGLEGSVVRPSYYYSNWMMYLDAVQREGILPSFFPPDLPIPMIAPGEVSSFIADVLQYGAEQSITEITGPTLYSPEDIARLMGDHLGQNVRVVPIPESEWLPGLLEAGFSQDSASYLMDMTKAVIDGKTDFTMPPIQSAKSFPAYLRECMLVS